MTSSPLKFAAVSILVDFGYSADRSPPYKKRFIGTEHWLDTVENFYRSESDAERRRRGVSSIAIERMGRTIAREAAWYLSRTNDFALAEAGRQYDIISRANPNRGDSLRRWGSEKADA